MKLKIREGMKISDSGMVIDVRTEDCLYIRINGWTYYIDDSTDEQITDKWVTGEEYSEEEYDPNVDAEVEWNEGRAIREYEKNNGE